MFPQYSLKMPPSSSLTVPRCFPRIPVVFSGCTLKYFLNAPLDSLNIFKFSQYSLVLPYHSLELPEYSSNSPYSLAFRERSPIPSAFPQFSYWCRGAGEYWGGGVCEENAMEFWLLGYWGKDLEY